jgi:hypothetical protein
MKKHERVTDFFNVYYVYNGKKREKKMLPDILEMLLDILNRISGKVCSVPFYMFVSGSGPLICERYSLLLMHPEKNEVLSSGTSWYTQLNCRPRDTATNQI